MSKHARERATGQPLSVLPSISVSAGKGKKVQDILRYPFERTDAISNVRFRISRDFRETHTKARLCKSIFSIAFFVLLPLVLETSVNDGYRVAGADRVRELPLSAKVRPTIQGSARPLSLSFSSRFPTSVLRFFTLINGAQ